MLLNYEHQGGGAPLIVLHGLYGSRENWHSMARRLAKNFSVFAMDLRNHGESPHSDQMNYPAMAEDLLEWFEGREFKRAHILGHSMGGKVAMEFSLAHPERVDRLIVADIAPKSYSTREKGIVEELLALDLSKYGSRGEMEAALAEAIPDLAIRRFLLKDLKRNAEGRFEWRMNLRGIERNYEALAAGIAGKRVFDKPTLFLRGEKSRYIKGEDIRAIKELFPKAEIETVEGAGHWLHVEKPERFIRNVREFLLAGKTAG